MEDDIMFDEAEDTITTDNGDIVMDSDSDEEETLNETNEDESNTEPSTISDEQTVDTEKEDEEDIDLDSLFNELDDANEVVDKIEEKGDNENEVSMLKQTLNNFEQMLKKLSNEKADLVYKNAELEAFGSDNTDPKILLLSRNLAKAKDGDDKSKTKTISILKDMLYDLSGEDIDNNKINKDIDLLSAVEKYNSVTNPNLKSSKKQEDDGFSI